MSRRPPSPTRSRAAHRPMPGLASPRTLLALAAIGAVLAGAATGWLPAPVAGWILFGSVVAVLLYAHDKRAARRLKRRVPERTLQLLAFSGGWPGALLAQGLFHHKNRKVRFQRVFWLCAATNIVFVVALIH